MAEFNMDDGDSGAKTSGGDEVIIKPSGKVLCPNHGCELEGVPWPMPEKGTARCPVSKAMFEYEAKIDPQMKVQMKDGTVALMSKWEITGDEKK